MQEAILRPLAPFSPLFIGEDSSIPDNVRDSQPVIVFQSPLHRGRLFNRSATSIRPSSPISFSPLFIGEDSSMVTAVGAGLSTVVAFSPLFIGEDSSMTHEGKTFRLIFDLSVPSSSGKTLQSLRAIRAQRVGAAFSPLFIGEDSSIACARVLGFLGLLFQSPLHRGRLFNSCTVTAAPSGAAFQSPLHRGRLFNMGIATLTEGENAPFSPLFIGEDSSICGLFVR